MRRKSQCEFQGVCPYEGSSECDLERPENCDYYYELMDEMDG